MILQEMYENNNNNNKSDRTKLKTTSIVSQMLWTWLAVCADCGPNMAHMPVRNKWHTRQYKNKEGNKKIWKYENMKNDVYKYVPKDYFGQMFP